MTELGGFFAVSYLADTVFFQAIENLWRLRWRDARGLLTYTVPTPFGELAVTGAFSLAKPGMAFAGALNAVRLGVSAALRLDLQLDGAPAGGVFIETIISADLPVILVQEQAWKKATLDLSQFVLTSGHLRLTWYDGPSDARAPAAVLSDASLAWLTGELRRRLKPYLEFSLPTDLVFAAELAAMTAGGPGSLIYTPLTKLGGVRVLDGWLALGIDDAINSPTHGDLASIGAPPPLPPGAGKSTAILVIDNALTHEYLNRNAKFALRSGIAAWPNIHPAGAPEVLLHDNSLEIINVGTIDAPDPFPGVMPYRASITVKPFEMYPGKNGLIAAQISPNVQVYSPWFLKALGTLADCFGADVFAKLRRANEGSAAVLFHSSYGGDVPGVPGMRAGIHIEQIVLQPDLVAIFIAAGTSSDAGSAGDLLQLSDESFKDSVKIRERYLKLRTTYLLHSDPTYLLRYQIRRGSDGAIAAQGTAWSGASTFGDAVDLWDPANYLETAYSVEVVAERPPGTQLGRSTGHNAIWVQDLFDRAHPYARWHRVHWWYNTNQPREGTSSVRQSAVHKTAIQERCQFADAGTSRRDRYTVQALDALPPPDDPDFSSKLCPYCFPAA